jgi:hypothetical protein
MVVLAFFRMHMHMHAVDASQPQQVGVHPLHVSQLRAVCCCRAGEVRRCSARCMCRCWA